MSASSTPTDESLLADFVERNDRAALGELCTRYQSQAYALANHAGLSATDAEDAAQSAFLELIRSARSFRRGAIFRSWFFRIVLNVAFKKRGAAQRREQFELPAEGAAMEDRREMTDPHAIAASAESLRLLDAALQSLPEKLRLPIVLRYRMGLDGDQAAHALGCPETTFRTWLKRGLDELRTAFEARAGLPASETAVAGLLVLLPLEGIPPSLAASLAAVLSGAKTAAPAPLNVFARSMLYMKANPLTIVAVAIGAALAAAVCMPTIAQLGAQRGSRPLPNTTPIETNAEAEARPGKDVHVDEIKRRTRLGASYSMKLGMLISSGVPLASAVKLAESECADPELKAACKRISADVEKGDALGVAIERHSEFFPTPLPAACAKAGTELDVVLLVGGELLELESEYPQPADADRTSARQTAMFMRTLATYVGARPA